MQRASGVGKEGRGNPDFAELSKKNYFSCRVGTSPLRAHFRSPPSLKFTLLARENKESAAAPGPPGRDCPESVPRTSGGDHDSQLRHRGRTRAGDGRDGHTPGRPVASDHLRSPKTVTSLRVSLVSSSTEYIIPLIDHDSSINLKLQGKAVSITN